MTKCIQIVIVRLEENCRCGVKRRCALVDGMENITVEERNQARDSAGMPFSEHHFTHACKL